MRANTLMVSQDFQLQPPYSLYSPKAENYKSSTAPPPKKNPQNIKPVYLGEFGPLMCKLLLNHCGESKSMRKEFKKYKPEVDLLVIHLVVHQNENIHPWLVRHEYKNHSSTESLVLIDTAEVLLVNADEVIWIFSWLMKTLLIFNLPFHDLFVYLFFAVSFGSRILSAFPVTHQPLKSLSQPDSC